MVKQGWDYIVVGGGAAGCVLTARLSEDDGVRVLLLEAGPRWHPEELPRVFRRRGYGLDQALGARSPLPEVYPDFYWRGILARRAEGQEPAPYARGRGLGGSSIVHGLIGMRGLPEDFEDWVKLGCTGWSWQEVLPYFCRLEDDLDFGDAPYHGRGGPLPIAREQEEGWGTWGRAFREAAERLGYPWNSDINAPEATGVVPMALTVRNGERVTARDAYLTPAERRGNLTVLCEAPVERVLVDVRTGRCLGVRTVDGREFRVSEGGEVLLCAGAANSPAILMRSGIGPDAELRRLGIRTVVDLPVGRAVQDHVMVRIRVPIREEHQRSRDNYPSYVACRCDSGIGPSGRRDLFLMAVNHAYWFGEPEAGIAVMLYECRSRGEMVLTGADPTSPVHFELRLLSDPSDLQRLEKGVELARALLAQESLRGLVLEEARWPDRAQIQAECRDVMHLACTAPMGMPGDGISVVDPECRVHGVQGLRVIDASAMPKVVRANTYLTVVAMAERMSDRLRSRATGPGPGAA
ncbi:MAG: GMC family oxidoreductase [Armatimonadota bacterium]|nr:GMC family oxidoreductase [Armatimonadota bacterium]